MREIIVSRFVVAYDKNLVAQHLMAGTYQIDEEGNVQGHELTITPADIKEALSSGAIKEGTGAGVA